VKTIAAIGIPKLFSCKFERELLDALKDDYQFEQGYTSANAEAYIDFVQQELVPHLVNVAQPRFIGHMTGPVPPLVHELHGCMGLFNQNLVKLETSGIATQIEREVIGDLHRVFFNEPEEFYGRYTLNADYCLGNITSGGTLSNITALSYALSKKLGNPEDPAASINNIGLLKSMVSKGYTDIVVLGTAHSHYSMNKAMRLLGLGYQSFIKIDPDILKTEEGSAQLSTIITAYKKTGTLVLALVGVAGTTEAGIIDPLEMMAEVAAEHDVHFHVDAAFGGAFMFSDRLADKLQGISRADTITLCGHKQLYLPMGISICMFKSPELAGYAEINSHYQARKGGIDLGKYTIEGSRPFSAFIIHGVLQLIGKEGYAEILENNYDRAQFFGELVAAHGSFERYTSPELNIVLYRYVPAWLRSKITKGVLSETEKQELNRLNVIIQKHQFEKGNSFVSYTELPDAPGSQERTVWLRAVLMNPYTSPQDLQEILQEQVSIAEAVIL
jgi:glutamate decarboxylase